MRVTGGLIITFFFESIVSCNHKVKHARFMSWPLAHRLIYDTIKMEVELSTVRHDTWSTVGRLIPLRSMSKITVCAPTISQVESDQKLMWHGSNILFRSGLGTTWNVSIIVEHYAICATVQVQKGACIWVTIAVIEIILSKWLHLGRLFPLSQLPL